MKYIIKIGITLFMLMGIIHAAFTPAFYKEYDEGALWFLGTGLCLFFLGMLNIGAIYAKYKPLINFTIVSNIIGVLFLIAIVYVMPAFQAILVLIFGLFMLYGSFWMKANFSKL